MIALPIYLQMVLEYTPWGRPLARAAVAEHVRGGAHGRPPRPASAGPSAIIRIGFALLPVGSVLLIPIVPRVSTPGWYLPCRC